MENYYTILNISKTADAKAIKQAYRNLAMKYHPDKNPDNKIAEERFKRISEAYSILSNPQKRATYDMSISSHHHSCNNTHSQHQSDNSFEEKIFNSEWWKEWRKSNNKTTKKKEKISRWQAVKTILRGIILTIIGILLFKSIVFLGIFGLLLALLLVSEGIIRIRKGYTALTT